MIKQEVLSILDQYGLSAKKSLGQNFLCNENVISDIIDLSEAGPQSRVLEIGPGIGALSEKLVSRCEKYMAIEIDTRFQARLEECIEKKGGTVLFEDYLTFSPDTLPDFVPDVILSNLPYYVMTPIMLKVMKDYPSCPRMVYMVEEEACDRIFAKPNSKQYGPLSVLTSLYGEKEKVFRVDGASFYPAPNTTSAVIRIERGDNDFDPSWISFVESAFALRRKTLVNSLSSGGKYGKEQILSALSHAAIPETIRSEALLPENFTEIYKFLQGRKDE